jgi:uncharacterized protein
LVAYLDASVIVPLFLSDAFSEQADELVGLEETVIVGDWASVEVSSVIARQTRIGAITTQTAQAAFTGFDSWRWRSTINAEASSLDMALAADLVRKLELGLRGPDALHIAMAHRLKAKLLTFDTRMKTAAQSFGIAVG